MTTDFAFHHTRVIPAGAAEAAPVTPSDPIVWDLRAGKDAQVVTPLNSLILLAQGGAISYEVGFWNATVDSTASFIVADTGTLADGAPKIIAFPAEGARAYVRSTGVTAVNTRIYCMASNAPDQGSTSALAALLAQLVLIYARQADGTQKSIARGGAKGVTTAGDVTSTNVSVDRQALDVAVLQSALPSGAATELSLTAVTTAANIAAGQSEQTVTTLRTFNNTVSDADTDASSFVTVTPQLGGVQVEFNALVFGNSAGVTATSVRFRIYGRSGGVGGEIFLIDAFDVLKANAEATVANRLSNLRYNVQCDELAVTMRFLDGTSPIMVSGNVTARPISLSAKESSSEKIGVTTGLPKVEQLGYDSTTDAQKIVILNDLYPRLAEPNVVSGASLGIATAYWPSSAGVTCGGYKAITFDGSITGAGGASVITVTAESSIDGTVWRDITLGALDEINHAYVSAALTATAGASLAWLWTCPTPGAYVRLKVVVGTNITGAYALSICRHHGDV